ncbi:stage III sporulation protein AF [Virgibacillus sp. W0181]|uniref:stage III sporulation protein AF n=1 Tax=Virgibacillus sp. W0181 TaxID=3391581 RepID=UPI003F469AB8
MNMLIEWITEILIFLLLAAIIDLLIPKTAMKKYVKLVMGLILLLIFLKPLFILFQIDIETSLQPAISSVFDENQKSASIESSMEFQKKEIQASQDAYILEQMENHLIGMANTPLAENYHLNISGIQFSFQNESKPVYEELDQLVVYLTEAEDEKGAVSAVEEVVINTDKKQTDDPIQNSEEIKDKLEDIWELEKETITIQWEGGT